MTTWPTALTAARQALARLELCATGTVTSRDASHGHPDSAPPPATGSAWWGLRERLRDATTVQELDRITRAANAAWEHEAGRGTASKDRGQGVTDDQLVLEAVGHDAQAVAWRHSWDAARVRRHRMRNGQDPETGRPVEVVAAETARQDRDWRQRRVVELAGRGRSERQIRQATGLARGTVRRMLGRAA